MAGKMAHEPTPTGNVLAVDYCRRYQYPEMSCLRPGVPSTRVSFQDMPCEPTFLGRPYKRRRGLAFTGHGSVIFSVIYTLILLLASHASAAFVGFDNCLSGSITDSTPLQLQFVPLLADVSFIKSSTGYHLNISIYGNVSGQVTQGTYPPPDSADWSNPNDTFGKIVDIDTTTDYYTTMFTKYNLLTYTPYTEPSEAFCNETLANTECPMAPVFYANASDPADLRGFSVGHTFNSSYSFGTLTATIQVKSGDVPAKSLGCITASVTPDLGSKLGGLLTWLPAAILIFMAIAVMSAAMFSPWGSLDPFRWTSNYGRDSDLLRLVTPGFGDCLQYIQFIVLSGSLTLQYPGFFQPVVSQASWAALMFNESFVSHGGGRPAVTDGIYVTNSTYGLGSMSQLVGMSETEDIWAGMAVWTLIIVAFVVALCQLAFLARFVFRAMFQNAKEDLTNKNGPFTGGMLVRVIFNWFLLPIVSLTMFQLVLRSVSPAYLTALAVVLLVALLAFAGWIMRIIFTTQPRSTLFDDLPKVLLYGPLYNTYSDDAAPFALIPALLTFIRGVAIGAVQPSGIAQLVILAICEVVLILTLHAFRPFHSPTSMNAYHTFFAAARLATVLLMVAFVSSMDVIAGVRGWIGYAILLLHGIVLVFGFFLNALQRIIETAARLAGAGGEEDTGAARRGGLAVLGVRQLSRRRKRTPHQDSLRSDAAMLNDDAIDAKSTTQYAGTQYGGTQYGGGGNRSRSQSANSANLLNQQQSRTYSRLSSPMDQATLGDQDPETPNEARTFSFLSGLGKRPDLGPSDPYFRAPRPRRQTGDLTTPGAKSRSSWVTGGWADRIASVAAGGDAAATVALPPPEPLESVDKRDSSSWPMAPLSPQALQTSTAYRSPEEMEAAVNDRNVDYAVRESDFYYGVRGPALSSQATRKLKTGPADPVGPASNASGWFKGIFSRKNKETGKGFEVVRSSRVPLQQFNDGELSPQNYAEQYHDSPQSHSDPAYLPGQRTRSARGERSLDEQAVAGQQVIDNDYSDDDTDLAQVQRDAFGLGRGFPVDAAPSIGHLDLGGGIELPSRFNSRVSRRVPSNATQRAPSNATQRIPSNATQRPTPSVPRKSSRRLSQAETPGQRSYPTLSTTFESSQRTSLSGTPPPPRLPFTSPDQPRNPNRISTAESMRYSMEIDDDPSSYTYAPYTNISTDPTNVVRTGTYGHRATASNVTANSLAPPSLNADYDHGRPMSTGFVNQFRAGESVHAGLGYVHAGSSAEVIDEPMSAGGVRRRSVGPPPVQDEFGGVGGEGGQGRL